MKKIIIKNDLFEIDKRLKTYNQDWFIAYDKIHKKFEIHNKMLVPTKILTLPFKTLDVRAIKYVLNLANIDVSAAILEVENNNNKITQQKNDEIIDKATQQINEIVRYVNNSSKPYVIENSFKTKWV